MKRICLIILLMAALTTARTQIREKETVIGLTVGAIALYYGSSYNVSVPPLTVYGLYGLTGNAFGVERLTIGIGGSAAFMAAKSVTSYGNATLTSRISETVISVKATGEYPLFNVPELDTYISILLGWGIARNKNSWEGDAETIELAKSLGWEPMDKVGGPLFGITAGCRYWFTEQLAGNVEIGSGPAFLNIGGSYRF